MIISSVTFQNFLSFKNEAKVSFLVNENAPQTQHFVSCDGQRISKVSSIFGANASGKTNIMLAINFLSRFISRSFSYPYEGFPDLHPFETIKNQPSFFIVEFYIEDTFYKLSLQINSEKILSEILESRKNKRLTKLYSREYCHSNKSYTFKGQAVDLEDSFIGKVRPNASVISTARQYNNPELTKVSDSWASIFTGVRHLFHENSSFFDSIYKTSKYYHKHDKYFKQAKEILKKADLGLSDIQIRATERENLRGDKKKVFRPYGIHKSKGKTFELPFPMESGGTLHLYDMLSFILPALQEGSVCLVDEAEKHLHPNMLPHIINLFTYEETNPKGAQLICTTHMPTLMADLSKYQIFLVEKNNECESEVYRLDEVNGVRNDDNLLKKYLAGAYGGVPDIDL